MTADTFHYPDQVQLYCPHCQVDLTLAKHENGAVRAPQPGDNTVCFRCLAFLVYVSPEAGQLRLDLITPEGFDALPERSAAALLQVRGELERARAEGDQLQPTRFEAALALEVTALKARVVQLEQLVAQLQGSVHVVLEEDRPCPTCHLTDCVCEPDEGEDT